MLSIVGITPHPAIIIPEIGREELGKVSKTVAAMQQLAGRFKALSPEILIVITPHGSVFREGPSILTADKISGNFGQFGFPGLKVDFQTDRELLALLGEETAGETLQPVYLDDQSRRSELDHGAMVPLYYLHEAGVNAPGLHITFGFNKLKDLYNFGKALRRAIERRGLKTALVASGDLSHRLFQGAPAGYTPEGAKYDHLLVELIRHGRVDEIVNIDSRLVEQAGECGLRSFVIALGSLAGIDFKSEILSYEGPFGVGYLVAALEPAEVNTTSLADQSPPALARQVLEEYLRDGTKPDPADLPEFYRQKAGVFVTLKKEGRLRGCIGTFEPVHSSLAAEIAANAVSAATRDPRFPPVSLEELKKLTVSVDVLSPLEKVNSKEDLDPKTYGLFLRSGRRSGLLLPDLEGVDTVDEQVSITRQKAGILPEEPVELYRFQVTRYRE